MANQLERDQGDSSRVTVPASRLRVEGSGYQPVSATYKIIIYRYIYIHFLRGIIFVCLYRQRTRAGERARAPADYHESEQVEGGNFAGGGGGGTLFPPIPGHLSA